MGKPFYAIAVFFVFLLTFRAEGALLQKEGILVTDRNLTAAEAAASGMFQPFDSEQINLGFSKKHLWVRLTLTNPGDTPEETMLVLDNPLLETVDLYPHRHPPARHAGMLHILPRQSHILPAFSLTLPPHASLPVLLHIRNTTTALQFGIRSENPERFYRDDRTMQNTILLLGGMLLSLALLSVMMYFYSRDRSYLLYLFYLGALIFQQLTYTGFLPLYAPAWFTRIDNLIVVPKVALMIIAAALYARAFLRTEQWPEIDRIYRFFVFFTLVQIPFAGTPWFYFPEATVLTGFLFILFNTAAGIIIYRRGHREARFFIAAWLMLVVSYLLMIADALGLISVMHLFRELIMAVTVVEALLLMLAFVDRYQVYQGQKLSLEQRYNRLLSEQKAKTEAEVVRRTAELDRSIREKETLFMELHHRVRNNLQLMLSIIRLQHRRADSEETKEALAALDGRIETIARTHESLYRHHDTALVDMQEYLSRLNTSIIDGLSQERIRFECRCPLSLPPREAVYLGLIVNELIINTLKHASPGNDDAFSVEMSESDGEYRLDVGAPGLRAASKTRNKGLGLVIVETLATDQLGGTLDYTRDHLRIRFRL